MNLTKDDILWNRYSIFQQYRTLTDLIMGLNAVLLNLEITFVDGQIIIYQEDICNPTLVGWVKSTALGGYIICLDDLFDGHKKLEKKLKEKGFSVEISKSKRIG